MEKYYNFTIAAIHLLSEIDDMYDYTIYAKVRKAIDELAPSIWGEQIIPLLSQLDIYCPEEFDGSID